MRYCIVPLIAVALVAMATMGFTQGNAGADRAEVDAIADTIKAGNAKQAAKLSEAFAKKHALDETMHLYKLGTKAGLGIGPPAMAVAPNGIEKALQDLANAKGKLKPADVLANPQPFDEMAWRVSGLADVTQRYAPLMDRGKKTKKIWLDSNDDARTGAADFRAAIQAKNANGVAAAAKKIVAACNTCHSTFR